MKRKPEEVGGHLFHFIAEIQPERDGSGQIIRHLPQARYKNKNFLPLHKYGKGPFCKFKIPSNLRASGVYLLLVNGQLHYIGECADLSQRYNSGYGNISPRNCYEGGQQTNCRINHLILQAVGSGKQVTLWFHSTADHKALEADLREKQSSSWNRV